MWLIKLPKYNCYRGFSGEPLAVNTHLHAPNMEKKKVQISRFVLVHGLQGINRTRTVSSMKTAGEKVSDFPSSLVLALKSPAVANSQPDTRVLSLARTQTHIQIHAQNHTQIHIHASQQHLKSLWKSPKGGNKDRAQTV